jgi:hypothetical protein
LAFFFFVAMIVVPCCVLHRRQVSSDFRRYLGPLGRRPLAENNDAIAAAFPQSENRKLPWFFRSLTDIQVSINQRSAR